MYSRQLVAAAKRQLGKSPDLALLLGVAANTDTEVKSPKSREILIEGLNQDPRLMGYLWRHTSTEPKDSTDGEKAITVSVDARYWPRPTVTALFFGICPLESLLVNRCRSLTLPASRVELRF